MAKDDPKETSFDLDIVMEKIGNAGPYQKSFFLKFNLILPVLAAMPYMNLIISLATPDHWCLVPGREYTNYTIDAWKNLTIPRDIDSKGLLSYSKCRRFVSMGDPEKTVQCDHGWSYDYTWYDRTASTQNDWVCENEMVPANTIAVGFIGEVVGTFLTGYVSDNYGRMPMFFISLSMVMIGRIMSSLTSDWTYLFMFFSFIGSLASTTLIQGPLVIAMEISRPEDRALIGMIVFLAWNAGLSILPLLMWWLRDWVPFLLATTLPCGIYLFSRPWIIESPRWLVSKGKVDRCIKELQSVANANKTEMPTDVEKMLLIHCDMNSNRKHENRILGFFSSPRLVKNAILLMCSYCIILQIYIFLVVNVTNLDGNPFLNYLFQALAEFPGFVLAKVISDRYGRRYASFVGFSMTFVSCTLITFFINGTSMTFVINALCVLMKFSLSLAYLSVNLQALEIYPTCIRQTGISVGIIFASSMGTLVPYIINLGISVNAILPYMIYIFCALLGMICCIFLPETLGHQLPETLADARIFGAEQDLWGRSRKRHYMPDRADALLKETINSS
ncbi:organic cation transporter 1-like [Atheta coriaria]|uniref:organic cation transporter 1-like n=1 Tax=Dalotia coriaria TaxID=877792 RepID=UPI0031F3C550